VTWRGDDWNWWISGDRHGHPSVPAQFELVHEILAGVPGRENKTVAHVGPAGESCLQFLSAHFAGVVQIDPIHSSCRRYDIVLAVETLARPTLEDLDVALERVHGCVVEGGLLLATFPAARPESVAREMLLRGDTADGGAERLHEVELQYRLRRAGFRGVRIRRILDEAYERSESGESLLCLAVRRANN
jgi:hypothetical protein